MRAVALFGFAHGDITRIWRSNWKKFQQHLPSFSVLDSVSPSRLFGVISNANNTFWWQLQFFWPSHSFTFIQFKRSTVNEEFICLFFFLNSNLSVQFICSVVSDSLRPHGLQHTRFPCPSPACSNSRLSSQWCHPTMSSSSSPSPPTFNLSHHQGFFKWVSSLHQVAKVWEFQLQHRSFQWTFRTHFL